MLLMVGLCRNRREEFEQPDRTHCCLPDEDGSITFPYPCFHIGSSDNQYSTSSMICLSGKPDIRDLFHPYWTARLDPRCSQGASFIKYGEITSLSDILPKPGNAWFRYKTHPDQEGESGE